MLLLFSQAFLDAGLANLDTTLGLTGAGSLLSTDQPSGGFFYDLDGYGSRRKAQRLEQALAVEEAQAIEDELDRSIALLLREQETKEAERAEITRLRTLAKAYTPDVDNERVLAAFKAAQVAVNLAAFEALSREIERMNDEEDQAVLMMLAED